MKHFADLHTSGCSSRLGAEFWGVQKAACHQSTTSPEDKQMMVTPGELLQSTTRFPHNLERNADRDGAGASLVFCIIQQKRTVSEDGHWSSFGDT